jgi:hypothetical protein
MPSVTEKNKKGAGRPIKIPLQYYTVNENFMKYPKAEIRRLYADAKLPHISVLEAQFFFMEIVKYGLLNTGFYTDFSEAGRHILYENIIKMSSDDISKDNFVALVGLFVSFGIFDRDLYETHNVLSCKEMQEHYFTIKAQITRGYNGYRSMNEAISAKGYDAYLLADIRPYFGVSGNGRAKDNATPGAASELDSTESTDHAPAQEQEQPNGGLTADECRTIADEFFAENLKIKSAADRFQLVQRFLANAQSQHYKNKDALIAHLTNWHSCHNAKYTDWIKQPIVLSLLCGAAASDIKKMTDKANNWLAKGKPDDNSKKELKELVRIALQTINDMPPDDVKATYAMAVIIDIAQNKCGFRFNEPAAGN